MRKVDKENRKYSRCLHRRFTLDVTRSACGRWYVVYIPYTYIHTYIHIYTQHIFLALFYYLYVLFVLPSSFFTISSYSVNFYSFSLPFSYTLGIRQPILVCSHKALFRDPHLSVARVQKCNIYPLRVYLSFFLYFFSLSLTPHLFLSRLTGWKRRTIFFEYI